jgi:nitroreductase
MIEAGTWAPSSTNVQPWRFILVTQRELITRMAQLVREKCLELSEQARQEEEGTLARFFRFLRQYGGFFGDASAVIVACAEPYDLSRFGLDEGTVLTKTTELGSSALGAMLRRTVEKSVVMAVQNLLLKAHELGYGSCVMDAPLIVEQQLRELLDIPPEQQLVMVIPVGVPARLPQPRSRRSIAEVVRYAGVDSR